MILPIEQGLGAGLMGSPSSVTRHIVDDDRASRVIVARRGRKPEPENSLKRGWVYPKRRLRSRCRPPDVLPTPVWFTVRAGLLDSRQPSSTEVSMRVIGLAVVLSPARALPRRTRWSTS